MYMAGAVRSKYLRLLTVYACSYALLLLIIALLSMSGMPILPVPWLVAALALVTLGYYLLAFRFTARQLGRQAGYIIGVAILTIPMTTVSAMSGGYESFNNIAIIILIFLSAMLGYVVPLVLAWVQLLWFAIVLSGYLPGFGSTGMGLLMLGFFILAAAVGWIAFHSYYTREDPETERLRQTLREEQLQSEGVITAISDGVAIVNKDGITLHANQRFLDMVALTREELIGKHYSKVISDKVRIVASSIETPRIGPNVAKVMETGESVIIDNETIEYIDGRPSIDLTISITALKNDDGYVSAVMIIGHDISHIMRLQRMKDALIATASHELRTPITVIAGYADLLLGTSAGDLNDKQRHYMERTKETTAHLTNMVNDMLDISRLESGQRENNPEAIDIVSMLQQSVEDHLGEFAGKQIVLKLDAKPGEVFADRSRLRQVIDALLGNAYKFTPEEGTVTLQSEIADGMMRISIIDTGPGIPDDRKEIIFEKFTKLDDTGSIPGTGLGLAIAKTIVENWKGTITVEDAPGSGARFCFTVPLAKSEREEHLTQTEKEKT